MEKSERNHLIVFVKNAELGKVKTRLAATLGDEKALGLYLKMLELAAAAADQVAAQIHVFYSNFVPERPGHWLKVRHVAHVQCEGDLGERMLEAFQAVFGQGEGEKKVVIIGTDCPELNTTILNRAFELLEIADCVMGPSLDGGYYLLGMKKPLPEVFEGMEWSTPSVCAETQKRIFRLGKSLIMLPKLRDVDNEADYLALSRFFQ